MNFYDYWMKLSNKEREEIFYQKAIPINNLEELKGMIDKSKENSLIAISYQKKGLDNKLYQNISEDYQSKLANEYSTAFSKNEADDAK